MIFCLKHAHSCLCIFFYRTLMGIRPQNLTVEGIRPPDLLFHLTSFIISHHEANILLILSSRRDSQYKLKGLFYKS